VSSGAPLNQADRVGNESAARQQIVLQDGEARTNIQLRLADGTRLVAQFNPSHTVNDLHSFINT